LLKVEAMEERMALSATSPQLPAPVLNAPLEATASGGATIDADAVHGYKWRRRWPWTVQDQPTMMMASSLPHVVIP